MKPLVILGMLGAVGGAALAVMVRSSLKDQRLQKDSLNRSTLASHNEVREQIAAITATNETFSQTATNAKNEELSTKGLATDIKGKEDELAATKKDIEDLAAKKQAMQEEITRILGSSGTPEEI